MLPLVRRLSVLIYHRVTPQPDALIPEQVWANQFDAQMRILRRWFNVLPLREAAARLRAGRLPRRSACITFDDGYADNATVAAPILRRHGLPATFFVATGFLDGGRMWNDTVVEAVRNAAGDSLDARCLGLGVHDISTLVLRRRTLDTLLDSLKYLPLHERQASVEKLQSFVPHAPDLSMMMTSAQVRDLARSGMEVGAHTVSHPILAKADSAVAKKEIAESKRSLESITGGPVTLFAYPNGRPGIDYLSEHVEMVKTAGFDAAVTTAAGVAHAGTDLFQLPRFTPWDKSPAKYLLRLVHNSLRTSASQV